MFVFLFYIYFFVIIIMCFAFGGNLLLSIPDWFHAPVTSITVVYFTDNTNFADPSALYGNDSGRCQFRFEFEHVGCPASSPPGRSKEI